ncbi:MAG: hypothetical protein ACK4EY_10725 [Flavipsychrobacter sp.]
MKLKTDQNDYKLLTDTINKWVENGNIDKPKGDELLDTLEQPKSTTQQIAQYFFFVALSCILLAFAAIFIDDKFLEKLKQHFSLTNFFIAILFTVFSVLWFYFLKKKKSTINAAPFEIYAVIGGLLTVTALTYYSKETGEGPNYSGLLLGIAVVLFALAGFVRSYALWMAGILATMGWFGAFSTWLSHEDLFLGMNYPVRFSVFGMLIILASLAQKKVGTVSFSKRINYLAGLIIFFTGLWSVSIFGNYNSLAKWAEVRQTQVIIYAIVFAVTGIASFLLGIKYKENAARDIGIIALLTNLYTRYFEYFWDSTNKGIFFLILALSFWFIGKRLEKFKNRNAVSS